MQMSVRMFKNEKYSLGQATIEQGITSISSPTHSFPLLPTVHSLVLLCSPVSQVTLQSLHSDHGPQELSSNQRGYYEELHKWIDIKRY